MSKISVLLIENQYLQFRNIRARLQKTEGIEYKVIPEWEDGQDKDRENYKKFMDQVRIALNPRFKKHSDEAFKELLKYIVQKHPQIFIIDHKLVGNEQAQTGIELARRIWDTGEFQQPVIFLSRTPESKREVVEKLDGFINKYRWLHKGYSDHEVLDQQYFNSRISPAIRDLLQLTHDHSKEEDAQLTLTGLFTEIDFNQIIGHEKMIKLRERSLKITSLTDEQKKKIEKFKLIPWPEREQVTEFYLITLEQILKAHEN